MSDALIRTVDRFRLLIPKFLRSSRFSRIVQQYEKEFVRRVQKRGVGANQSRLEPLKKSYQDIRKKYKENLSSNTRPTKSNATATGQMIDNIESETTKTGFEIRVKNTRRTGELTGTTSKLTNRKVAEYYNKKREIFKVTDLERKKLARSIKKELIRLSKRGA